MSFDLLETDDIEAAQRIANYLNKRLGDLRLTPMRVLSHKMDESKH